MRVLPFAHFFSGKMIPALHPGSKAYSLPVISGTDFYFTLVLSLPPRRDNIFLPRLPGKIFKTHQSQRWDKIAE